MSASPAESAVRLPWLAPGATALAALAGPDTAPLADFLRTDPGFAVLWLRSGAMYPIDDSTRAAMLRQAIERLQELPAGLLDDSNPAIAQLLSSARRFSRAAEALAGEVGYDSLRAAVAGLLVPLGWFALAAESTEWLDPSNREFATAATRKLTRTWALPNWLTAAIGNRDLPPTTQFAGDPALCDILRRAAGDPFSFAFATPIIDVTSTFGFFTHEAPARVGDAYDSPYLRELLVVALANLDSQRTIAALEPENEALRRALCEQHAATSDRLKVEKLSAMAEFAAGAGHEINNPLAVISGQAQYLLVKEYEPECERALHVIIQQSQRIHQTLTDLMQFARPSRSNKRLLDVRDATRTVATNLHEFAALQRVRIELITPDEPCPVETDLKHLQTALASLLRNAIEAAPEDGWARVTVELVRERIAVVVEDSGDGPSAIQREHLFDPFYSGRLAGRGRGLGLPTAWRLAREQGGDVAFDPRLGSPARFVLTLPRGDTFPLAAERKIA